jgi:hypothetical protein
MYMAYTGRLCLHWRYYRGLRGKYETYNSNGEIRTPKLLCAKYLDVFAPLECSHFFMQSRPTDHQYSGAAFQYLMNTFGGFNLRFFAFKISSEI